MARSPLSNALCLLVFAVVATEAAARDSVRLDDVAESLAVPGSDVVDRCEKRSAFDCGRDTLGGFIASVRRAESPNPPEEPVRVVVLGNSLIASDGVIGQLRRRLVQRFGDGGRGLLLVDRLGPYGPRARTGHASPGWALTTVGELRTLVAPHGLSGAQHRAEQKGARSRFTVEGETEAQLYWLPGDGAVSLLADGQRVPVKDSVRVGTSLRSDFALPPRTRKLELVADPAGAIIQGVVLEKRRGGVVVDTLGVPSADASLFLRAEEKLFVEQLRAREPSLVVVMLGGNEVKRLAWKRSTPAQVEEDLRTLVRRTRLASPTASCLLVGPIDSVQGGRGKSAFTQRPQLATVLQLQRRVAAEERCAYLDLYEAMGGEGSLVRFHRRGFIHEDLVHPKGKGLDLLGDLVADALLRAVDGRPLKRSSPVLAGTKEDR